MAKRSGTAVSDDFASVVEFLKGRGVVPTSPSPALIDYARKIHAATYSRILWRFALKRLPIHGQVFVDEIASDALQVLPQVLLGYGKTTKLLIRGVVENTMRHLYFIDHRIEFDRMNRDGKWFVPLDELFGYALGHPEMMRTEPRFDAINRLKTLYGDLSAAVHGRRVQDLETKKALRRIMYSDELARSVADLIRRCSEASNFVLAALHRDQVRRFRTEDRRTILRSMSPRARAALTDTGGS